MENDYDHGGSAVRGAWGGRPQYDRHYEQDEEPLVDKSKRGCWSSMVGCIGGMWATRQMTKKEDREIYVRTTLRELVVYIIFLIVLCILTFGMASSSMYYHTQVLSDLFLDAPFAVTRNTLKGSTQKMDFWRFSEQILLDGLYTEYYYNVARTPTVPRDKNVLFENKLLGVPRVRQIMVRNDSCDVADDFKESIRECYAEYSPEKEETRPIINKKNGKIISEHEVNPGSVSYQGRVTTYEGSGYSINLGKERNKSAMILTTMRELLWVDRGTRAVFYDFTVYNANINLFCVIKIVFEFPATGGMIPSWSFRTIKLLRYVTVYDHIVLACEIVFTLFIIYYIIEEVLEISTLKCKYFYSLWNILDLVVIGLATACITFNVYNTMTIGSKLEELLNNQEEFSDFDVIGYWQVQFNALVAICVFCAWFKLFKYISFNKTMTQLFSTLSRCAKDVAGFAVIFFIVFFAFAQLGYLLFGTQVKDFSSFMNAIFTLLRTVLGDFNFNEIQQANRVLGPIYFLSYVFFVFFVLLNMFLAIINDTYSEVKTELANQMNEFNLSDYFMRGYNNVLGAMGKRDKAIDLCQALQLSDINGDGTISFEEIRRNFKKCNYSDREIEMFFSQYDVDGNRLLEHDEIKVMLNDLGRSKKDRIHETKPPQSRPISARSSGRNSARNQGMNENDKNKMNFIDQRVVQLEENMSLLFNRLEIAVNKDEVAEKKKQMMSKMMDDVYNNH